MIMGIASELQQAAASAIRELYGADWEASAITVNETKPEFEGDYTIVLFAQVKQLKKSPELLGEEMGKAIVKLRPDLFKSYNVIKGFLNLSVSDSYYQEFLHSNFGQLFSKQ